MVLFFYTHKRGETYSDIQDSICVDEINGRYAISDGVTNSFLPQVLSRILTDVFLSLGMDKFPPSNLNDVFLAERDAYLNSLDEDQRFLQEMVEEEFHDSAATFIGVEIHGDLIRWKAIGDSCLFTLSDDGALNCYSGVETYLDNEDKLCAFFTNHPDQIRSDGSIKGNFIEGELPMFSGWMILASDALSAWFIKAHNNGRNPISILLKVTDNDEFEKFVEKEYQEGNLKSDDESIIIIRLDDNNPNTFLNSPKLLEKKDTNS